MVSVKMDIPEDVLVAARITKKDAADELRKELAVHLFEREILSFSKAAELAKMSKWDFMSLLGGRKIPLHYDEEDLDEDIETFQRLRSK
jgi:predicted HTH domain antitoxin